MTDTRDDHAGHRGYSANRVGGRDGHAVIAWFCHEHMIGGTDDPTEVDDQVDDDDADPRDGIDYAWEADYRQHSSSHTGLYEAP